MEKTSSVWRGAGGGVRACGARERARARERERSGQRRETAERRGARARERAERRGARAAERDSIADGTALRCGRVGSRHFRELEEKSPGSLVFVSATLLICLPFKKIV